LWTCDLTIVRGLAYYTGTVFELFDAEEETPRHLRRRPLRQTWPARWAEWISRAVGFGFGDVVLGELLKDKGLVPTHRSSIDVFIAAITGDDVPHALKLAHDLRTRVTGSSTC
jgi:histidyl-tRNA synthetase